MPPRRRCSIRAHSAGKLPRPPAHAGAGPRRDNPATISSDELPHGPA